MSARPLCTAALTSFAPLLGNAVIAAVRLSPKPYKQFNQRKEVAMASAKVTPQENPQAAVEDVQKSVPKKIAHPAESPAPRATIEEAKDFVKLCEFAHLRTLQSVLAEEIRTREKDVLQPAKAEIRKIAESVGMPVEVLMAIRSPKSPDAPKKVGTTYQDPNNPTRMWKGMGARPQWFK